jgi:hypothetical protein
MQPSDAEIADRLRAILQSDEFQPSFSERMLVWLERAFRTVRDWLEHLGPAQRLVVVIVSVLVLAAVVFRIGQLVRYSVGPSRFEPAARVSDEQVPLSPALLVERALSLADGGFVRDAARALQQALLLQACQDQNVAWRPSLSEWEWIRLLQPSGAIVDFTYAAQRLAFGPEPSREAFDACAQAVAAFLGRREHTGSTAP